MSSFVLPPSLQSALRLPLIETIAEAGGRARPGDLYKALADKLGLDDSALAATRAPNASRPYRIFQQQVRWARQTAVLDGLISRETRGVWELTRNGRRFAELTRIKPGHVVLLYRLDDGVALCAHAEDAASLIAPGSLDLILTSPPYPVVQRSYGRFDVSDWLAWMSDLMGLWRQLVRRDGTIAINLMDVHMAGSPNLDPYVERFTLDAIDTHGLNLAGRMPWISPTKLGHIQWSAKERHAPRNTMEHILLFSPSQRPAWDASRLPPRERAARTPRQIVNAERRATRGQFEHRPSGHKIRTGAFGVSPPLADNVFVAGGASGADGYSRACRASGAPAHPARFPREVPRRVILLTTDVGDICYDPMAGSNTTGEVARALGRRWISSEPILDFAESSRFRFA